MISSSFFMTAYEKFYLEMRNYLWDLYTLELLADVQIATYQAFVDVEELEHKLSKLYQNIRTVAKDDDYLQEAYDDFHDLIEDNIDTPSYYTLYHVQTEEA